MTKGHNAPQFSQQDKFTLSLHATLSIALSTYVYVLSARSSCQSCGGCREEFWENVKYKRQVDGKQGDYKKVNHKIE